MTLVGPHPVTLAYRGILEPSIIENRWGKVCTRYQKLERRAVSACGGDGEGGLGRGRIRFQSGFNANLTQKEWCFISF